MCSLPKQEAQFSKSIRSIFNQNTRFRRRIGSDRASFEDRFFAPIAPLSLRPPFLSCQGLLWTGRIRCRNVGLLFIGPLRTDQSRCNLNIFTFRPHQARTHMHQTRHIKLFGCIFHFPAILFHHSDRNSIEDLSSKWLPKYRAPSSLGGNRETKSICYRMLPWRPVC